MTLVSRFSHHTPFPRVRSVNFFEADRGSRDGGEVATEVSVPRVTQPRKQRASVERGMLSRTSLRSGYRRSAG